MYKLLENLWEHSTAYRRHRLYGVDFPKGHVSGMKGLLWTAVFKLLLPLEVGMELRRRHPIIYRGDVSKVIDAIKNAPVMSVKDDPIGSIAVLEYEAGKDRYKGWM